MEADYNTIESAPGERWTLYWNSKVIFADRAHGIL